MKQKTKTVSLHYKRRRADAVRDALGLIDTKLSAAQREAWLAHNGYPAWTRRFEVRRARTRFHYKVVAVS